MTKKESKGNHFLILRKILFFAPSLENNRIYLLLGRTTGVFDVYLNGALIGIHGTLPPRLQYHSGTTKSFYLPDKLINWNRKNHIEVRIYHEAGAFTVPPVYVGDIDAYYFDTYPWRCIKFLKFNEI